MGQNMIELPVLSSGGQRRSSRLQATPAVRRDGLHASQTSTPADQGASTVQSSRSTSGQRSPDHTARKSAEFEDQDPTPSKRTGLRRKRADSKAEELVSDPMEAAMKPLIDEERRSWPGWVELESEPTLFNFILREYGIKDVKCQEVISLDEETLNLLPQPVYGLIFLFRYWDAESEDTEEAPRCPNHVWFANQTITNACATIALLNIVMNVPKIDLGENLSAFKAETKGLKPPYRGQALGENDFIRCIHNSFARRLDMLNADLSLSNDFDKWNRAKKAAKRKCTAQKSQRQAKKKDEEEPGFHFIAYVPINGIVWRLDGMQRQPVNLGEAGENWLAVARQNINLRIAQYDAELQFNVMSLCRSPLRGIPEKLAENLHSISAVEKALNAAFSDWKAFVENDESCLPHEPNDSFALSKELFANSYVSDRVQRKLKAAADDPTTLIDMRRDLLNEQVQLQTSYVEEVAGIGQEDEQAARRKVDYTPIIYNSIKELAEKGVLKEIVRNLINTGEMQP